MHKRQWNKTLWIGHRNGELTWTSLGHNKRVNFPGDRKCISRIFNPTRPVVIYKILDRTWRHPTRLAVQLNPWHLRASCDSINSEMCTPVSGICRSGNWRTTKNSWVDVRQFLVLQIQLSRLHLSIKVICVLQRMTTLHYLAPERQDVCYNSDCLYNT